MAESKPLRIGDDERNKAVELLSEHLTEGRLTQTEFNDRLGIALQAKTTEEIEQLFEDLPGPNPGRPEELESLEEQERRQADELLERGQGPAAGAGRIDPKWLAALGGRDGPGLDGLPRHLSLALQRLEDLHRAARPHHRLVKVKGSGPLTGPEVRWGIVGPGRIAASVLPRLQPRPGASVVAVASRSAERAADFAAEHGSSGRTARTPRSWPTTTSTRSTSPPRIRSTYEIALAAIQAGKALLVEKTFTATVAGAEEVVAAARDRGVFAMEAMWTRFQPAIVAARRLVDDGAIGEVRQVQADLGVDRPYDPTRPALRPGPGRRRDARPRGVPGLVRAVLPRRARRRSRSSARWRPTGVDYEAGLLLGYPDGRPASLLISLRSPTPGAARIQGTGGWIEVPPRFHHPNRIVLHRTGQDPETIERAAARPRLRPRADRGHRGDPGGADRERRHAAGRHPGRAADPERRLRAARGLPLRSHSVLDLRTASKLAFVETGHVECCLRNLRFALETLIRSETWTRCATRTPPAPVSARPSWPAATRS